MSVTLQLFSIHNKANYKGGLDSLLCFGRDADGHAVKVDVEGFSPFFYVQMTMEDWARWYPVLRFISLYKRLSEKKFEELDSQEAMCELLVTKYARPPFHRKPEVSKEEGYGIREVKFSPPDPFIKLNFRNWHALTNMKYLMRDYNETVKDVMDPSGMLSNVNSGSVGTENERKTLQPLIEFIEEHSRYEFKTYEGCYDCGSMFLIHFGVNPSGWLRFRNVVRRGVYDTTSTDDFYALASMVQVEEGTGPALSPVKILSYDIEAVPHVLENGETLFPQPERDPICTIGVATYQFGTCEKEMHAFCLGETPDGWTREDDPSDDDFDPSLVHVQWFDKEAEMLIAFSNFIRSYDPDFITGYNIVNFDNYYTLMRASALAGCSDVARQWGRGKFMCTPKKKFSQSKQTGGREYWDVKIVGREFLDIFAICKIDHKLRSYKLDEVAAHFLGTRKIEIRYDDIPNMCKTPEGRKRLAVYCVKDAYLPLQLCLKLSKLQNTISLSYVTGAPINHILNRGQQIRCLNIIVRCARKRTPRLYVPDRSVEHTEGFKGAVVIDPIKGYYENPVIVMDFASLYPSIMIANNMCFSTKITRADARREKLTQGEDYLAVRDFKREGDTFEYIDKEDDVCFLIKRKGILPEILETLLANRKIYKKKMKKAKEGTLDHGVANGMQLALKICANSVYGFSGASRGVLTDPEISSSVTKRGRGMTNEASWYAETKFTGTRTVYGDTDSIFIELDATVCPTDGKSEEEVIARAKEWGDVISSAITKDCFRAPNDLEYEKCFYPFLLKGKKRYAGLKFEPGKKTKMDIKGFECVRRDYAPFVSSTQLTVFQKLVGERDRLGAIAFAKEVVRKLVQGELELSDLTMSKQLTRPPEQYKSNSIHVELAKRLKRTLPETMQPKVGDRIDYVVRQGPEKLYQRGVQPHEVMDGGSYSLDVDWYLNNQLREPYMRIFDMVMDNASSIFHIYDKDNESRKLAKRKAREVMKAEERRKKMKVKDIRSFFS